MDNFLRILQEHFGQRVKTDEPMALHTALKIGGPAKLYVELDTTRDIITAVTAAKEHNTKFVVIGTGSKTLFSESGFDGLVIKNNTRKFDVISRKGKIRNNKIAVDRAYIYADSGALINQVVRFAIEQEYSGLEHMLGLTGTIGGRLFTNADNDEDQQRFDQQLYQIQAASYDGTVKEVTKSDLLFTDKNGRTQRGKYVILTVIFELFPGHAKALWEKGTQQIEKRSKNRPENVLSIQAFSDITVSEAMSIPTPGYTRSVRYLIENAGLVGRKVGGAMISDEYPDYIINSGNATSDDMIKLMKEIKSAVHKKFGVSIREAVSIIE